MSELVHDPLRRFLDTSPERVVALYVSSNQPQVQAAGRQAQPAHAAVVGLQREDGTCEVAVALHLPTSGDNVVYACLPIAPGLVPDELEQAVFFAESMGFLLDDVGIARMTPEQRAHALARTPQFHPPRPRAIEAPTEQVRPKDALTAVARLFAAFALPAALLLSGCATGMSAEQRVRDAEIHYELGSNMLHQGDPQAALREWLAAAQSNPEMPQAHGGLGFLYAFSFGRPAEAEEEFRRAIDIEPTFSDALNNFGAFYLSRGRYAEAIPLFERALANPLYPERYIAEGNLGWALFKTGKADKGIVRLRSALHLSPKYCKGWRELGLIYSETGKIEDAAEAFGRYAGACPDAADAHLQNGKMLVRLSRGEEARGEFEKCAKAAGEQDAASVTECTRFLKELGTP